MYKYKKIALYACTCLYLLFTFIEFVKYLKSDSTLFGLVYLLISLIIIFLLVPCAYNYKKYYSMARISKLMIVIVIGIFTSYILPSIVLNNMSYMDSSKDYIKSIFLYKNIFKGIIYGILVLFTAFEFKLEKIITKNISRKSID